MKDGIEFCGVTKRFGDETVLSDFSLALPFGETVCVMGRSGVGKTTVFRLILGLIRPDQGKITIAGRASVVAVFQENRLLSWLTAVENAALATDGREADRERARDLLARMGLDADLARKRVRELSGGQQRRAAIARALIADADVVLMDEPLKGLDDETARQVCAVIRAEMRGRTLIFSTHDRREAEWLGARVVEI